CLKVAVKLHMAQGPQLSGSTAVRQKPLFEILRDFDQAPAGAFSVLSCDLNESPSHVDIGPPQAQSLGTAYSAKGLDCQRWKKPRSRCVQWLFALTRRQNSRGLGWNAYFVNCV